MEPIAVKRHENEATERILHAATSVFADVGFAGARVDEIAKRADMNKALIYYHIGSKETLYGEVIVAMLREAETRIMQEMSNTHSPEERLRQYIRSLARFINEHPDIAPIMLREIASEWEHFPAEAFQMFQCIMRHLSAILTDGQTQGVFVSVSPILVHFMIISPIGILGTIRRILAGYDAVPERLQYMQQGFPANSAEQIEELVLRAIKK